MAGLGPARWLRGGPDLTGCYRGRFFGLEVKTKTEYPTPLQRLCHRKIVANGGYVAVVRCWEDCMKLFRIMNQDADAHRQTPLRGYVNYSQASRKEAEDHSGAPSPN